MVYNENQVKIKYIVEFTRSWYHVRFL
jgi:hypothetical protein